LRQFVIDEHFNRALDLRVAQLGFCLPFELGLSHLDGQDSRQAFAKIISGKIDLYVSEQVIFIRIRFEGAREGAAKAGYVRAAFMGIDVVDEGENVLRIPGNGKQVGGASGLTPTPFDSGKTEREQGISKAGSRWIRGAAIEFAWGWLRFQPESEHAQWYQPRFGQGSKRLRKIGIVALARKLLVALWRFLETGLIPEGARLRGDMRLR
jgi:hypothetical protein